MIRSFLLAAGCAALALASQTAAARTAPARTASAATQAPPASEPADWGKTGLQTRWIDRTVKPGDDFARYVNGKWHDSFEIPPDKTSYGAFQQLAMLSEARLHAILEELVAGKPAPGSDEGRVVAAYTAFMDQAAIERAGLAPARPWLDRIAAAKTTADLYAIFAAPGFPSPINGVVDADPKQSDRYALALSLGGLGLPDRDYYLSDNPRFPAIREKYKDYLTLLLSEAGYGDARARAESIHALETGMARAMWDRTVLRDSDLTYNKLTIEQVAALPHGADLVSFIRATGPGAAAAKHVLVAEMPLTPAQLAAARISPDQAKADIGGGVPAMLAYVAAQPVDVWKAWLTARFLASHAPYLPARIDDANFAFYGKLLGGQPEQRARWKRAISVVESQLGELLGKIYAARYFPPENRAAMTELVGNLRKAMGANLATLSWMGPQTRAEAEAKLAAFTPKIGAPETYKDYAGLVVTPTTALANAMAAGQWASDFADARIGQAVDRSEWFMLPETVNAYYNPTMNEIVFPAAILQPPFFNLAADPAVNYGAIGAVIGHEMGHGFDDQGAKSDGQGNLRDWWSAEDKARFVALTDRLAAQYDKLCPFDHGQTCVNGKLTLGENIGDLGGLSLAYRAYHLSLGGKPAPVIDGLTGDQRFFMAWAQVWRSKYREETARQLLLVDPHAPPQYRINGIVRNFTEWYRAFGVKPGDKLYLPPEQRIRIW
ncbi:MAG: M13 family metallopeptidase [Sphingomonadales bacterium]|nr:M13 family metallopeptidase [Sphingomonadales bacterium]MBU3991176.1 M13 family metallopeptidase [Alphaproteobacteria bacterium]